MSKASAKVPTPGSIAKSVSGPDGRDHRQPAADRAAALSNTASSARRTRWAGGLSMSTSDFNVMRTDGTNTRRGALTSNWERPFTGRLAISGRSRCMATPRPMMPPSSTSSRISRPFPTSTTARALPQAAVDFSWPFARDGGAWGTQLIEPIAQVIVAPQTGDSQIRQLSQRGQPGLRILRRQPVRLQPFHRHRPAGGRDAGQRRDARRLVPGRHNLRRAGRPVIPHQPG